MNCYLCKSPEFVRRKGQVRDAPELGIVQCTQCGLVSLDAIDHISSGFYEKSGMHGSEPATIDAWLKETHWDDQRRFDMIKVFLPNKRLLDFGCGAAGFLEKANHLAAEVMGIELEERVRQHWQGRLKIVPGTESAGTGFDLITAFHVLEHLPDPRGMLRTLSNLLAPGGRMIIEVPSSDDVLLSLYDCAAFQGFTYWSQHLFLFNAHTLETIARQAGMRIVAIEHFQRYPLSNHLHWLSQGGPGGHQRWGFLDTPELTAAYGNALAAIGKTDTLIAHLEPNT